jgi:hypothetical protein
MDKIVMDYEKEFLEALNFTKEILNEKHKFVIDNSRFLTDKTLENISSFINKEIISLNLSKDDFFAKCFQINYLFIDKIKSFLKCDVFYTVGYIIMENDKIFYTPKDKLANFLTFGYGSAKINLHAWLTLPTLEIIDLTFSTTYAILHKKPDMMGLVVTKHPSDLTGGLSYHPQIIGFEYFKKIGVLFEI